MTLTWSDVPHTPNGLYQPVAINKKVSVSDMTIIGIPMDLGASATPGQREAPFAIRRSETFDSWHDPVYGDLSTVMVCDYGDIKFDHRMGIAEVRSAAMELHSIMKNTRLPVVLGGDHSVSAMTAEGLAKQGLGPIDMVTLDAHADTWPYDAHIMYPDHSSWVGWVMDKGYADQVYQLGVRALGPDGVRQNEVRRINATDPMVDIGLLLGVLNERQNPIHLSIDLDVVDPAMCPGVAYPEPGGWLPRELLYAIENIVATGRVKAVDITETTPALDHAEMSVRLAHRSVLSVVRGIKRTQP